MPKILPDQMPSMILQHIFARRQTFWSKTPSFVRIRRHSIITQELESSLFRHSKEVVDVKIHSFHLYYVSSMFHLGITWELYLLLGTK